jgi:hypothetical protein
MAASGLAAVSLLPRKHLRCRNSALTTKCRYALPTTHLFGYKRTPSCLSFRTTLPHSSSLTAPSPHAKMRFPARSPYFGCRLSSSGDPVTLRFLGDELASPQLCQSTFAESQFARCFGGIATSESAGADRRRLANSPPSINALLEPGSRFGPPFRLLHRGMGILLGYGHAQFS